MNNLSPFDQVMKRADEVNGTHVIAPVPQRTKVYKDECDIDLELEVAKAWANDRMEESRKKFMEEARLKMFYHVYMSELPKGKKK